MMPIARNLRNVLGVANRTQSPCRGSPETGINQFDQIMSATDRIRQQVARPSVLPRGRQDKKDGHHGINHGDHNDHGHELRPRTGSDPSIFDRRGSTKLIDINKGSKEECLIKKAKESLTELIGKELVNSS